MIAQLNAISPDAFCSTFPDTTTNTTNNSPPICRALDMSSSEEDYDVISSGSDFDEVVPVKKVGA